MSGPIKPEDISVNLASDLYNNISGVTLDAARHNIAAIINASIDAGLVSPPCRILRSRLGKLDKTYLFIDDNEAQSHASPGDSSEHWRGQTDWPFRLRTKNDLAFRPCLDKN